MIRNESLLQALYQHEYLYVDEIDRLQTATELVTELPEGAFITGGWLFMAAEAASGDWNLARLVGRPEQAAACVDLLTTAETSLLAPEECAGLFELRCKRQPDLYFFFSDGVSMPAEALLSRLPPDLYFETRAATGNSGSSSVVKPLIEPAPAAKFADMTSPLSQSKACGISVYLLADGQIQGYVKTIRQTQNFSEVYIELKPNIRGRGLAVALLHRAIEEIHRQQKKLTYVVAADNAASLATARRAGLRHAFSLARFIL